MFDETAMLLSPNAMQQNRAAGGIASNLVWGGAIQ